MADAQKTEKPTPRRLTKARADGQFPLSREVAPAISFAAFVAAVLVAFPRGFEEATRVFRGMLIWAFRADPLTVIGNVTLLGRVARFVLPPFCILLVLPAIAGAVGHLATTRFAIHGKKLLPEASRLNPFQKLKSLPGQNVAQLSKAILVLGALIYWCYTVFAQQIPALAALPALPFPAELAQVAQILGSVLKRAAYIVGFLGLLDFLWQKRQFLDRLKMSKQEVKEESKEQEGNPHTKQRIRRIQRDLARKQMMKEVAKATAVVVNPTHYAVALRYLPDAPGAPRVVAKGKNFLAARIRQRAIEHQVPIVENPPLARALYSAVDVGHEIPAHLYRAVAEILAYIQRMLGKLPGKA